MASLIRRRYKAKDKNGKVIQKQSPYWYIDYKTAGGTRKRIKGFKDKTATAQLAAKLEKEAELAESGVIDKFAEHRKRPLLEHIEDFRQSLLAKGDTLEYARLTVYRVKKIIKGCGFTFWTDIRASKTQQYLASLRNKKDGLSSQTSNYYLQSIKQFCRWMVQDQRAGESPTEYLKGLNVRTDRRHDRRALEPDEIRRLLEATAKGPLRFGMSGYERYLLYRLAAESGLRANEIRNLTVGDFDFSNLRVTTKAGYSKRRREDVQSLRPDMVKLLKEFFKGKMVKVKAFGGTYKRLTKRTSEMIKADLAATEIKDKDEKTIKEAIPYIDDAGRYADFHSLRHTTGSLLAASGVHPKVAQSIMRHSNINLTMSRYTHTLIGQEAQAILGLPDLSLPAVQKQISTGTDDLPVTGQETVYKPVYKELAKNTYSDKNRLSSNSTLDSQKDKQNNSHKSLETPPLGNKKDQQSPTGLEWAGVDLNHRHTDFQSVALPTELPARKLETRLFQELEFSKKK